MIHISSLAKFCSHLFIMYLFFFFAAFVQSPEPIIGESVLTLDPITSGMSLISYADDVITAETIQVEDVESIQVGHPVDAIHECKKDLFW